MMSRSPHTFLSKNRQIARVAITAIAMLAMAGPALTREDDSEGSKKDEVFKVEAVIQVPGAASFFSFDISWFDPKLNKFFLTDRNNKTIDVVDPKSFAITQFPPQSY